MNMKIIYNGIEVDVIYMKYDERKRCFAYYTLTDVFYDTDDIEVVVE